MRVKHCTVLCCDMTQVIVSARRLHTFQQHLAWFSVNVVGEQIPVQHILYRHASTHHAPYTHLPCPVESQPRGPGGALEREWENAARWRPGHKNKSLSGYVGSNTHKYTTLTHTHTHTHKMRVRVICHETNVRPGRASAAVSIPALDRTEAAVAGHTVFATTRPHCRWGLSHTLVTGKNATAITLACSTLLLHTLSLSLTHTHTHTHAHTHTHTRTHTHTCAHTARKKESMSVRFLHRKCLSAHTYTCTCRHSTTNYAPCRMFVKHKIAIPKNNISKITYFVLLQVCPPQPFP